ncbi:MAG: hypothetical protein H5U39_09360 [Deferribacterales bacterium]|nr:hypothetical protein [Deferribacterales bacterium]
MMDSKKQKKLPDDTYVMLDVSEDVATQVRALVRELECEDLFRTDKVLNAWDRFIIQFYNDNVPELADSLFNYLMRDIPDEYFDAFSRIYWEIGIIFYHLLSMRMIILDILMWTIWILIWVL